jgi:hypothetical protein
VYSAVFDDGGGGDGGDGEACWLFLRSYWTPRMRKMVAGGKVYVATKRDGTRWKASSW